MLLLLKRRESASCVYIYICRNQNYVRLWMGLCSMGEWRLSALEEGQLQRAVVYRRTTEDFFRANVNISILRNEHVNLNCSVPEMMLHGLFYLVVLKRNVQIRATRRAFPERETRRHVR